MKRTLVVALAASGWVVASVAGSSAALAETASTSYEAAIKDYQAGRYDDAVKQLERLKAVPLHHEQLFYNLGCAYYRLGKLGYAIYNFERALALDPGFEDARFNLAVARKAAGRQVQDVVKGVAAESWWSGLVKWQTTTGWWVAFLIAWWVLLGVLFALRWVRPGPARAGIIAANSLVALLALIFGVLLAARLYMAATTRDAIVLPKIVSVREGPDREARAAFKLHAGLRVQVKRDSPDWIRIRLPNGLEGWVERATLGFL